nr:sporulation protein YqfD [Paenibacillus senegalensis]
MRSNLVTKLRGYVTIELKGERLEQFINLAASNGLALWDMRIKESQVAEVKLHVSDVFRLRPLLKKTGCRFHIVQRFGFPFFWTNWANANFLWPAPCYF